MHKKLLTIIVKELFFWYLVTDPELYRTCKEKTDETVAPPWFVPRACREHPQRHERVCRTQQSGLYGQKASPAGEANTPTSRAANAYQAPGNTAWPGVCGTGHPWETGNDLPDDSLRERRQPKWPAEL